MSMAEMRWKKTSTLFETMMMASTFDIPPPAQKKSYIG
jgi:hypothetical protein